MAALMNDALGIGLAAPQVGISHRVLVYRVEPDSPTVALVNPKIEWSSRDEEILEEGCLSLPFVHVDVERPIAVLVNARDEHGDELVIEATGLEARVIQHEIDHLDGDPDPRPHEPRAAQGGDARAARGRAGRRERGVVTRTVFLGTSTFAAAVLDRLAASPHRPQLVVTRPDRPAGRGRKLSAPPVADAARALGLALAQPESVNADDARAEIAAADPELIVVCAFGALIREPLLSDFEMINVHPSLLPRWRGAAPVERAMIAGDERDRRRDHAPDRGPRQRPRLPRWGASRSRPTTRTARSRRGCRSSAPTCCCGCWTSGRSRPSSPRTASRTRRRSAPPTARSTPARPPELNERVVRALSPHIGARVELADGAFLGVLRAALREPGVAGWPARRRPAG